MGLIAIDSCEFAVPLRHWLLPFWNFLYYGGRKHVQEGIGIAKEQSIARSFVGFGVTCVKEKILNGFEK